MKYLNNSRNFTNDISNKNSFISLKNEINRKIKETLFDEKSLFLSSSFNYFCTSYKISELTEEGKNISHLLDNISTLNDEEIIENNSIVSNNGQKQLVPSTESKKNQNQERVNQKKKNPPLSSANTQRFPVVKKISKK